MLTTTVDVIEQWKNNFEGLLNPTSMFSSEEAELGHSGLGPPISGAEVPIVAPVT